MATEMTGNRAYQLGVAASKRTTTYDLDAAADRFVARYGARFAQWFADGWTDHACG